MEAPAVAEAEPSRRSVRGQVTATLRHPASWAFMLVWVLAALTLALRGQSAILLQTAAGTGLLLVIALALLLWLTPEPPTGDSPRQSRSRFWFQVAVLLVVITLTGWSGLRFHNVTFGGLENLPLWSPLESALESLGGRFFGNDNFVRNPVLYMLLPGLILLLSGVRLSELGLRKGYRSWLVALPYVVVLAGLAGVGLATGQLPYVARMPRMLLSNFLQNGFMEEFLFRGALLTRLTPLIGQPWSLVISSWLFGVWHLGADTAMLQGDYIAGLAFSLVSQATLGLLFGLVAVRTRSLVAPTVAHITVNMLG